MDASRPFLEGIQFVKGYRNYAKKGVEKHGCPIFRCHPGVETVLVTDYASADAVFSLPPSVMNRDGTNSFGFPKLFYNDLLTPDQPPCLVLSEPAHEPVRRFLVEIMDLPEVQRRFEETANEFLRNSWPCFHGKDADGSNQMNWWDSLSEAGQHFVWSWLFGIDGLGTGKQKDNWNKEIFGIHCDRPQANFLCAMFKPPPSEESKTFSKVQLSRIESSYMFQKYYLPIGKKHGLTVKQIAAQLLFMATFNATGSISAHTPGMIAVLLQHPAIRAELLNEVKMCTDVKDLEKLPYLEAYMSECMRLFGRPKQYYRRALKEVILPTSTGRRVRIPKNTVLGVVAQSARTDPSVFPFPDVFDPNRFLKDPSLSDRIWRLGPEKEGAKDFSCVAGHNALTMLKVITVSLLKQPTWSLHPPLRVDLDSKAGNGVNPNDPGITLTF